jgi:hypothetical protein
MTFAPRLSAAAIADDRPVSSSLVGACLHRLTFPQQSEAHPDLYVGNREPALDDLLTDPTLHRLLDRDGIDLPRLYQVIADAKAALARR